MRFAIYVSLLLAILPFVLTRPFFGLCVYYVVSLLQPKYLCWHTDFQDAMLVGAPLVVGAVAIGVRRRELFPRIDQATGRIRRVVEQFVRNPLFHPSWLLITMVLLIAYISITRTMVPYPMSHTSYYYRSLIKVVLVVFLLTGLASDARRVRVLYLVIALSTAFWAIKGGFKVFLIGPHTVYGKTYDNNLFALSTVIVLPMVFFFALSVRHARWRALLIVCAALMVVAIIGSHSRAGFVALTFVLMALAWSSKYRLRALMAVCALGLTGVFIAGEEIRERLDSIMAYESDRSVRGRFYTWRVATELIAQSPLIGVGFNNFEIAKDRYVGGPKAAHNIYLQNLTELGILGHPLWLVLVFGSMASMYRFMRRARRLPPDLRWAYFLSRGLLMGMAAYCIHGFFHNEEYMELMFALIGLHMALAAAVHRERRHRLLQRAGSETVSTEATPAGRKRPRKATVRHPGDIWPVRPGLASFAGRAIIR